MNFTLSKINLSLESHSKKLNKYFSYGTAGVRDKAVLLDNVLYRIGLVAALRSLSLKATVGVMITASHNPEEDNGVKIIDPMGDMLEVSWENNATKIVNCSDSELLVIIETIIKESKIDFSIEANVVYAYDTRPSSKELARSLEDGLTAMNSQYKNYGLLTTPQLHYIVRCINTQNRYGEPNEEGYYTKLAESFLKIRNSQPNHSNTVEYNPSVIVDGANGIGALQMKKLQAHLKDSLHVTIINDGKNGKLNHMCGADFVKTNQKAPALADMKPGQRYASFDGDADRIVYYFLDSKNQFCLLDGDRIAILVASFLKKLLSCTGLDYKIGLVQTAYANGNSTEYIMNTLGMPVVCTPTGVKHLHHRALEFDIGVYFEANGHGTVLFKDCLVTELKKYLATESTNAEQKAACALLLSVINLINQTVGDALSDMLLVETILSSNNWSEVNWYSQYSDLASRLMKVRVTDRTVFKTTDAERKVTEPAGLQDRIDSIVQKFPRGRSFVRPSGTEDVVRVYAESDTQANANCLAHEVSLLVFNYAGGVGDSPVKLE